MMMTSKRTSREERESKQRVYDDNAEIAHLSIMAGGLLDQLLLAKGGTFSCCVLLAILIAVYQLHFRSFSGESVMQIVIKIGSRDCVKVFHSGTSLLVAAVY